MITVRRTVSLSAAPDEVFAYVSEVRRLPEWQSGAGITHVELNEPMAPGARFRMERLSRGRTATIDCTVTALEPGRRFAFDTTDSDNFTGSSDTVLAAANGGTRLEWTFKMDPPGLWRLLSPLIGREIAKAADTDFANLRVKLRG